MNNELLRIIDSICRDKNIDRDSFVSDIEQAMASALRKHYDEEADAEVKMDLLSGDIRATVDGQPIDVQLLGRIAAQTAKQMIIQKTRERERTSIFDEFSQRRGTIITGTVVRAEGGNLLVNIGRAEGFLPRSEQIPGETHQPGERIRVLILEVREQPNQVKIILSRSHPEFIERLFELEVPEVAEQVIEIRALAREAGYRTKVAVSSIDSKVDAVGACVGVRGSRIKNIVDELGGEKIDIVRWNESSQILIQNALKPAEVQEIALCFELGKATVVVAEDQLSLAIGKRGQNVRLAARLTGWDIDILTPTEYNKHLENLEETLKAVEGVDDVLIDKLIAFGCVSVNDIDAIGPDPLVNELELDAELAERVLEAAGEEAIRQEEEREAQEKLAAQKPAATEQAATEAATESESAFVPSEPDQPTEQAMESVAADTLREITETEPLAADTLDEPAMPPEAPTAPADAAAEDVPVNPAVEPESQFEPSAEAPAEASAEPGEPVDEQPLPETGPPTAMEEKVRQEQGQEPAGPESGSVASAEGEPREGESPPATS